ncbi:hypothetical protein [Maritimibacter sp. UBA3975]|uniref:hypothetical protein n=1 Tax=Maritimibacter sp. UBA3975 TaxID=1946833 RepID=UPI000C09CCC2|nr:hypothetical protein [Maritimibacter sp. UBA3975]MAM61714.1 hypothetical protein [Maritimibacter sp.]|tara:strand:- start:18022 stop:18447 length:426 start_codon:yes stop_codon:yes gene_type:complete
MRALPYLILLTAGLALTGCGAVSQLTGRMAAAGQAERPADGVDAAAQTRGQLSAGGVDYALAYRSHGLWRDASGAAGAEVGAPQITVARADGTPLTSDDILAARGVAKAWCSENPQFRRDTIFGDAAVVEDGAVVFSEICD